MREWYQDLLDYNCNILPAVDLLKVAGKSRRNQCQARLLIAAKHLASGNRAKAAEYFQKTIDTHVFHDLSLHWSRMLLTRMKQDPTWPPWLPTDPNAWEQTEPK